MTKPFKNPIYVTRPIFPKLSEYTELLKDIWKSKWLTNNGPLHQKLEQKIGKLLKIKHVNLFNNGTIALITAIKALDLKGEIITTPFTFAATPHSLSWNNITPIFCDIKPDTMCIDEDKIEALITPKTTAILAVHVFGNPCNVKRIEQIAKKHNLKVIYDAAHAFELEINKTGIGNYGDITMFSFHATKLFHTIEGGALASKNSYIKNKIDLLKNFGIVNEDTVSSVGINGKMNEIQAAMGLINIRHLNEEREKRHRVLETYQENLQNVPGISYYMNGKDIKPSYQYFIIRINEKEFGVSRDIVHERLKKFNVFSRKYFFPLCSNFDCYQNNPSSKPQKLPVANKVAKEVLSLPFYGGLTNSDVVNICKIIKQNH